MPSKNKAKEIVRVIVSYASSGDLANQKKAVQFVENVLREYEDRMAELEKAHIEEMEECIRQHTENERLREVLEFIAAGCLVPPDGGSPCLEDAIKAAKEVLNKEIPLAPGEDPFVDFRGPIETWPKGKRVSNKTIRGLLALTGAEQEQIERLVAKEEEE